MSGTLSRTSVALAGGVGNIRRMSMSVLRSGDSHTLLSGVDGIVRSDTIAVNAFSDNGPSGFKIRDKNYLKDKKKVCLSRPEFTCCALQALTQSASCQVTGCLQVSSQAAVSPFLPVLTDAGCCAVCAELVSNAVQQRQPDHPVKAMLPHCTLLAVNQGLPGALHFRLAGAHLPCRCRFALADQFPALRSSFAAGDGAGQAELLPHLGLVSAL